MGERRSYSVSPAVREQRRAAALVHGAKSEARIRPVAKNQKRMLLRKLGLRAGDLDAVSAILVDLLARSLAKLQLLDEHYARVGIVRADGSGEPTLALYFSALNSARLTAGRLGDQLARRGDGGESLEDYIVQTYGPGNGGGADE